MSRIFLLVALSATAAACTSPESTRTLGGGPGADTGNRGAFVMMHEGSKPYEHTPVLNPTSPPALQPAQHAHESSLR